MRFGPTYWMAVVACAGLLASCADPLPENPGDYEPYEGEQLEPLECVPNLDGKIVADEMTPQVGVPVRFLVSPPGEHRPVDLQGEARGNERIWDWSYEEPSDKLAIIEAENLDGKWYADKFPGGQFVAAFDLGRSLQAVYSRTDTALRLHGLASADQNPPQGKTLLVYESPVEVYRFPLRPGQEWISTGEVNDGTLQGLPYAGRDFYEVKVSAMGELKLPNFTFEQVHKVHTKVTVQPAAGQSVSTRQVSFLFECFGEVARATSQDGETEENFSTAAEVRRLGFN